MSNIVKIKIFTFCILLINWSSTNNTGEEEIIIDTVNPIINCPENLSFTISINETGTLVEYNEPEGNDNNKGAVTIQIQGLASGEFFPIGITTNIFEITDASGNTSSCSFNVEVLVEDTPDNKPYFVGSDPTPSGKKWTKIEIMSDEFDSDILDESKWKNTDPSQWIGRPPGLFVESSVSIEDGNLKLTADLLDQEQIINGNTFTHAGSYITSINSIGYGHYFECKMKANKTFMSSTFWLINKRSEGTGCDVRTTEFDIQETVGEITTSETWAQSFSSKMNSNTHSRNVSCTSTPTGSAGNKVDLGGESYEDYHVFAGWWKSPTEVELFLDGVSVGTVVPDANFDLTMYMKLVVETYDWNPVPSDGGMNGAEEERTTYYDWVRTWKLEDI